MTAVLPPERWTSRRVPASVDGWWMDRARAAIGGRDDAATLRALAPLVQALSDRFTKDRPERFGPYSGTAADRAAYGLFWFPQGWVRARLPLEEARAARGWAPRQGTLRLLDVGSGSGATGLSLAAWLVERDPAARVDLVAVDQAPEALRALAALARHAVPRGLALTTVAADARRPASWPDTAHGPFDLVVASFALNEMFAVEERAPARAWLADLARRLAPEGLSLVLEPGTQEQAARLTDLAADVVEHEGLHPWGPQLHAGPWRPRPDRRTWMHEVRRWSPPESLERVNRTLWRSVGELTFSYALLGRASPPPVEASPRIHRLCSPLRRLRGRLTWLGLGADGRLAEFEVQERDLTREERDGLLGLERGDVLAFAGLKGLGRADAWRVPGLPRSVKGPGIVDAADAAG